MDGLKQHDGQQLDLQTQTFVSDDFFGEPSTSQMLEAIFKESPDNKYATLMKGFGRLRTESEEISVGSDQENSSFPRANWEDDNLAIAPSGTEIVLPVNSTSISEKCSNDQMNSETLVSNENESLTFNVEGCVDNDSKQKNSPFYCSSKEEERILSVKDWEVKPKHCESPAEDQLTGTAPYSPSVTATCITKNGRQQININLYAKETAVVNVEAKNCSAAVVGDGSKVNIFQGNCCGPRRQSTPNEELDFDGPCFTVAKEETLKKVRIRHKGKKKQKVKEVHSDSNSNPENTLKQRTKNRWRFESVLSDFVYLAAVESSVIQWVENLVSYLLRSVVDLENDGIKIVLEEAKAIRKDVPNCIRKIKGAVELMRSPENCEFLAAVFPELEFALAEFYASRADYESALGCLKILEDSEHCKDTEKSRLYVKIAKLIEAARYARRAEVSHTETGECRSGNRALLDAFDAAERYFQKALEWNDREPSTEEKRKIQRCCFLGMAAIQMRLSEIQLGETPDQKDLEKARGNLELLGNMFWGITADMKCQFYMLEAYLRYFKGDYRMAASRANDAKELAQENCFLEARGCVGSKKLGLLLELLRSCSSGFEDHLLVNGVEETLADDEDSGGNDDLESLISSDSDD